MKIKQGDNMKRKPGQINSIKKENKIIPGCTISQSIIQGLNPITHFAMAKNTDISPEIYPYYKFIILWEGKLNIYGEDELTLNKEESIIVPLNKIIGFKTDEGAIFTEIEIRKEDAMNDIIKAGEVFKLADKVPYQEGKIVNMDLIQNDHMKFVIMAFDKNTGLSEHAAPGQALVLALEGEAIIGYEGVEHTIKAGETIAFEKMGKHFIKADEKFKMALLLTIE